VSAAPYPMRRWVFEDARGRYDIDLGDSNVDPGTVGDLALPGDLVLDYGTDRGGDRLRAAVAGLYGRPPADIGISHGGQESLYLLYRTLLRPGDHVLTFAPGWAQSWEVPGSMGCRVDVVALTADGRPDIERALSLMSPRTRVVSLSSPGNPTGRRVAGPAADALAAAVSRSGAYLIADEEYVADLGADSLVSRSDRVISVSSVSKVYGFPGLRTGWMCGPAEVVRSAMEHKHFTTIANSVLTEHLAAQVLERRDQFLAAYAASTSAGLPILRAWAAEHRAEVSLLEPDGTPFAWLDLHGREPSLAVGRRALEEARVLVMPAEVFAAEAGLRVTFARPPEMLRDGLRRLGMVLSRRGAAA
jgi:aspartate/methionine/tyrosine aminotransferase